MSESNQAGGTIYAIGAEGTTLVKIGSTRTAVEQRLRTLQVGQPFPLYILAALPVAAHLERIEQQVHTFLAPDRKRGEWFDVSMDLPTLDALIRRAAHTIAESESQPTDHEAHLKVRFDQDTVTALDAYVDELRSTMLGARVDRGTALRRLILLGLEDRGFLPKTPEPPAHSNGRWEVSPMPRNDLKAYTSLIARLPQDLADQGETQEAQAAALRLRWETQVQAALARIPAMLVDFPQVPITDYPRLPEFCAVYLFVKEPDTVLYVGVTKHLRERVRTHHRWRDVRKAGATAIAWLPQEDVWIGREIERHCMQRYAPRLNGPDSSYAPGGHHAVRLMRDELALVAGFAAQLNQRDASRDYSTADAIRIAALRYLRGALFPPQGEDGGGHA